MNPKCELPGCGLEMEETGAFQRAGMMYHPDLQCPRNADAHELCARNAGLERCLESAKKEIKYLTHGTVPVLPDGESAPCSPDVQRGYEDLESKFKASQERELALREILESAKAHIEAAISYTQQEDGSPYPASSYDFYAYELVGLINGHLSNTSATAQETVERIEREAVKKAWGRIEAAFPILCLPNIHGEITLPSQLVRAAILGEKEE